MSFCQHCGAEVGGDWAFCRSCGAALSPETEPSAAAFPARSAADAVDAAPAPATFSAARSRDAGRMARQLEYVPDEVRGWNWGAFFFGWLWGVFNHTYISLLQIIPVPFMGLVMAIVLGVKGNEWAWRNGHWIDVQAFKARQRKWAWAALICFLAGVALFVGLYALDGGSRSEGSAITGSSGLELAMPAGQEVAVFSVSGPRAYVSSPRIDGSDVVWFTGRKNGSSRICHSDLEITVTTVLARGDALAPEVDISDGLVAWTDHKGQRIRVHDLSDGTTATAASYPARMSVWDLALGGNTLAWVLYRENKRVPGSIWDAVGLPEPSDKSLRSANLASGRMSTVQPMEPDTSLFGLNVSERLLVWCSWPLGGDANIVGYDLSTGETLAICDAAADQDSPSVDGDTVVWLDNRGASVYYVRGENLATGRDYVISDRGRSAFSPAVAGDVVVWVQKSGGDGSIRGRNLQSDREFVIAALDLPADEISEVSVDMSGDIAVWHDGRSIRAMRLKPEWVDPQ